MPPASFSNAPTLVTTSPSTLAMSFEFLSIIRRWGMTGRKYLEGIDWTMEIAGVMFTNICWVLGW